MKGAKRLIPGAFTGLIIIGGLLLFFNTASPSRPTLVMKGYRSATNGGVIANLELRNTTGRDIWLYYSGWRYSSLRYRLRPEFLEKPTAVAPKLMDETNIDSLFPGGSFGSFGYEGKKVLPGDSLRLEYPIRSGESAKLVGIVYYVGRYSDRYDFIDHYFRPSLDSNANWKDKAAFYWRKLTGKFKAPERHEIWCEDLLSFEAGTNSPPPEPAALVK